MKALIQAIQTYLRAASGLAYVANANIFITPDENLLPIGAGFPAIGLKDGNVAQEIKSQPNVWEEIYLVDVIIYVLLQTGDLPIVGQADPLKYGVLDIRDDIDTVLHDSALGISDILISYCQAEGASEWMGGEDVNIQRKVMTYRYEKMEVK